MASVLRTIAAKLLISLATETFAKLVIVRLLQELAKKTSTDIDDDLVSYVKKAWGIGS